MGEYTKYKVVLNGTVMPNENRDDVIESLCELFHSRPSYMEKLLSGREVPLKKEYSRPEAEKISRAVRAAGAQCKLMPVSEETLSILEDDYSTFSMTQDGSTVICPDCQLECDPQWEKCQYCGSIFIKPGGATGFSFSNIDESQADTEHLTTEDKVKKPFRSDVMRFIGSNAGFYAEKFEKFGTLTNPKFAFGWHWPALFVFFLWALYRKLWVWAAIYQISSTMLLSFTKPSFLWLLYLLAWPLCANFIYYRHVASRVSGLSRKLAEEEKDEFLVRHGGVSKIALWIGVAATVAITLYSSSVITSRLLDNYEQQHGANGVTAAQMRGDGSVLDNVGEQNSKLAQTSKAINELATVMKLFIASGDSKTIAAKIDVLVGESENESIRDAWGGPIYIKREQDRVVISSAGPDGTEKNDDDILQFLNY